MSRLVKREYKVHALFRKDYRQFGHVMKSLMFKSTFYGAAMILFFMRYRRDVMVG